MRLRHIPIPMFFVLLSILCVDSLYSQIQRNAIRAKHVPKLVSSGLATLVGPTDENVRLDLYVLLALRNEDQLDAFLSRVQNPGSPVYRQYLKPQDFNDRFAATSNDYATVTAWAKSKDLAISETPSSRRYVRLTGTVKAVNSAFGVAISDYIDPQGRSFFSSDREPTVDLSVPLAGISGLDNATPPQSNIVKGNGHPQPSAGSGTGGNYVPNDMRAAYYGSGSLTGSGQRVAIVSFAAYAPSDLSLFYQATKTTSSVPVNVVGVNGFNTTCSSPCGDTEQVIDIGNAVGMAPGLAGVDFYESSSWAPMLNQIATADTDSVISCSWYNGDFNTSDDQYFKQFQAQGQTFVSASGDYGDYNNGGYGPPELDPYITEVGGTTLSTSSPGGPWSGETAWSLGSASCPYDGSGGGWLSNTYSIPSYQQTAGVINSSNMGSSSWRNSPDVAAEAACDNMYVSGGQVGTGEGGTSFAAPRWAGLIALANQQAKQNGVSNVGFLNTPVYALGLGSNYRSVFHDITSGNNGPNGANGFPAVVGYDLVTGWGSPIGAALINSLVGPPPPPPQQNWQVQVNRQPYGYNCSSYPFDLFLTQETNTSSTQWYFYLYTNSQTAPQFTWSLQDNSGTLASGTWTGGPQGGVYPAFTVPRAPNGTPSFTINGYYSPAYGCSISLSGTVSAYLQ